MRCDALNRTGEESPALNGAWNTTDNPTCANLKFNNYNFESQHYGTFSGNRAELAMPQFDSILRYLPTAQRAAHAAGYKGCMYPRAIGMDQPGAEPPPPPPVAAKRNRQALGNDQLDAPAFLAMNFITCYEYSLDRDFLEKKAYPYLAVAWISTRTT